MASLCTIILLICVQYNVGYSFMEESESLVWPPEYHMKAEKINLDAGIVESMEMWSSAAVNRSRIDFYGGLVKKYYQWETEDEHGYVYSLMPQSTEEYQNKITCGMQRIKDEDDIESNLPKIEHYEHVGNEELDGKKVEVWKYGRIFEEKRWQERILYTYKSDDYDIPVRFEAKNYLMKNGAMTAHIITNYYNYESTVDEQDLNEGDTDDCEYMGTLGEDFPNDIKHLHPAKETDVDVAFHSYKKHHQKKYGSDNEHEMRNAIFHENWEMIEHHNRQSLGYTLTLNQFADRTSDEMEMFTGLLPNPPELEATHPFHSDEEVKKIAEELPENFDLRMEGVISPVKNQAHCGSCWAFASTAAVEGAIARSNGGRIIDLSEQSLVDCAWGLGCLGCDGGWMENAFKYIVKHGLPVEQEYGSYLEQDGLCHTKNMSISYAIKGYAKPTAHNPQALKVALFKHGPVAVSINFNKKMRYYGGGIFYDPDCNKGHTNHGVVVVGFGVHDGTDYWIVKNSHGATWGQAGYILISATDNNCFVLSRPVYPIV
ncbi:crustapain-like [Leguminivora glycinivorella]|uniref:crustapain-like n=1 Tax=Leguminivora glycinivorella TaxID=1035111 RepID=UPI00200E15AE|nr:crustapain-like [Leguminivora glycinivorella]